MDIDAVLAEKLATILPRLNEKQRRLVLAAEARALGHVGIGRVAALLHAARYSLQANAKVLEGTQHADRNAQFQYLNEQVKQFLAAGQPVVSMDAKKKELIGEFKNGGREWQPQGWPERVHVHDFPDPHLGKGDPVRQLRRGAQRRLGDGGPRP